MIQSCMETFAPSVGQRRMTTDTSQQRAFAHWFSGELRDRRMSQSEFARRAGVSSAIVSNWALGTRLPSIQSAQAIAAAFDLEVTVVLAKLGLALLPDGDPSRERILGMVGAMRVTPDREATLAALLQMWAEQDRAASDSR